MMNTDENASETEEMDTKEEEPVENMITNGSRSPKENEEVAMEEDTARAEGHISFTVTQFSKMDKHALSEPIYVRNLPWRIMLMPRSSSHGHERVKSLGFFLQCDPKLDTLSWSCQASAKLTLKNHHEDKEDFSRKISHLFYAKENDWGFSHFVTWADILDPSKGYINKDSITVEVHVVADAPHGVAWDSKKHTGYVGLKNQGATCYMNSLLQTLYFTSALCRAVFQMPTENDDPNKSVAFALQRVFYELMHSDKAVGTKKLTKSFGWETLDSFMQHDVQELCRVLLDNMESKMKGTCVEGTIPELLEGKIFSYIKCTKVEYVSTRLEPFYDIQLNVKGKKNIYESFKEYIEVELLDGDNKYDAGEHGLQEAKKGVIFKKFPPVLHLQLMRFQYDPQTDANIKINDRYAFYDKIELDEYLQEPEETPANYTLHAVLVHSGDNHGGHYVVYVNPKGDGRWCKFDDDVVSLASKQEAIDNNYGGYEDDIAVKHCTNAYMLVYIRDCDMKDILQEVVEEDIPESLVHRLQEEKRLEVQRRKERNEAHLYMTVEVITEDQFCGHQGPDLFDFEKVRLNFTTGHGNQSFHPRMTLLTPVHPCIKRMFKVLKSLKLHEVLQIIAKGLGYPVNQIRPWPLQQRSNGTTRPSLLDLDAYIDKTMSSAVESGSWPLFIETVDPEFISVENGCAPLPSYNKRTDVLLFFKYFDPILRCIASVGHLYVPFTTKFVDLLPFLCEQAGLPQGTPLYIFEEVKAYYAEQIKDLNQTVESGVEELTDGDILCYQRADVDTNLNVVEFFRDLHHQVEVLFCDKNNPTDPGFTVMLSRRMNYIQVAKAVATHLEVDPMKLQFFKGQIYRDAPGNPLPCTFDGTLRDLLIYYKPRGPKKLYYQILSIPVNQLENKRQFKCCWMMGDTKEEQDLVLWPNKDALVSDLLEEAAEQLEYSPCTVKNLRLLEIISAKVFNTIAHDTPLDDIVNQGQRSFRIEEIPKDEMNLKNNEMLIGVAHFNKEIYQTFGTPFLVRVSDGETMCELRDRVKTKVDIQDKEFDKIKFAIINMGRANYLPEESDYVISIKDFQPHLSSNTQPIPKPWLGLDHANKAPKRSRYSYLERPIKIHN